MASAEHENSPQISQIDADWNAPVQLNKKPAFICVICGSLICDHSVLEAGG
jgi:hypothetical protein